LIVKKWLKRQSDYYERLNSKYNNKDIFKLDGQNDYNNTISFFGTRYPFFILSKILELITHNYGLPLFNKNNYIVSTITPFLIQETNHHYLLFPIQKLQKLAEGFYDKLSRMCVNNTMNTAIQNNY
jgi:hypothetical protein